MNLLPPGGRSPASIPSSSLPPTANSSIPLTPAVESPRSSPAPQAPVNTPAFSSAPGSPLVNLADTAGSHHHPQLKTLLQVESENLLHNLSSSSCTVVLIDWSECFMMVIVLIDWNECFMTVTFHRFGVNV